MHQSLYCIIARMYQDQWNICYARDIAMAFVCIFITELLDKPIQTLKFCINSAAHVVIKVGEQQFSRNW